MSREFKILFDSHYDSLCRVAYRIVKDSEQAREIVQEVFIEFWNKRETWASIRSPKAFLITSVYNRSLNIIRRKKPLFSLDEAAHLTTGSAEETVQIDELMKCLAEGINNLPEKCREIFLLSREEEMTYAQIAAHLSISVKTVENQMGIALKKLKKHFDNYQQYPRKVILLLL